jgi:hypothetical protein
MKVSSGNQPPWGERRSRGLELERLFAQRAINGQLSTDEFLRIDQLNRNMVAELQNQVTAVPPQEYVRAKRFVESLNYEATLRPA